MADREPPPLFEDDDQNEIQNEDIDMTEEDKPAHTLVDTDDDDDLFTGGGTEVLLDDDPLNEPKPAAPKVKDDPPVPKVKDDPPAPKVKDDPPAPKVKEDPPAPKVKEDPPAQLEPQETPQSPATITSSGAATSVMIDEDEDEDERKMEKEIEDKEKEEEEEEETDVFDMNISITEPFKRGDGMSAYMAYKVTTTTTNPSFKKSATTVTRRFSDFLGLHQKLVENHTTKGHIVPPAPEKSVVGMTKVKMSKTVEEPNSMDFVEKRRAALERFLNRTAAHPILQKDEDFKNFLEKEELPKATGTSALSGAGMKRAFSKVVDTAQKIASKVSETDQWFEDKHLQIENLDVQLKKLHVSVESMVSHRRDLGNATASFAKSAAMLGNSEEHTALSRAISQLAETEEKIDQLHLEQANTDFFVLAELLKDYIGLIGAVRDAFRERGKLFSNWQSIQVTLAKRRDHKAKLEISGKPDKIAQVKGEITEWEAKEVEGQKEFEKISKTIRKEYTRFDVNRVADFRTVIIKYLEALMDHQQRLIQYWEGFLPEAKAIA